MACMPQAECICDDGCGAGKNGCCRGSVVGGAGRGGRKVCSGCGKEGKDGTDGKGGGMI